ncbi:MAG: sigma-70 family RNA polymerase sigma factor [Phycisphaerae bacterium]|nr:sigma-70 family RNA polymerase sigma factor [Phycisphaerae bacterium]
MAKSTPKANLEEDLTLKLWEGDESAKGELLVHWGNKLVGAIRKSFPTLSAEDCEDVVCEAIQRFWMWREKFDPGLSSIGSRLYWFAKHVAMEFKSGQLKRHQARIRERGVDAEFFDNIVAPVEEPEPPDDQGKSPSPVQRALRECFATLSVLQQDILQAYGDAGLYELDAASLGVELGQKHKSGVPIPAGTIRTNKSRAWDAMDLCMKKKHFDLAALGYSNE